MKTDKELLDLAKEKYIKDAKALNALKSAYDHLYEENARLSKTAKNENVIATSKDALAHAKEANNKMRKYMSVRWPTYHWPFNPLED